VGGSSGEGGMQEGGISGFHDHRDVLRLSVYSG
jgi:hypothetical protein